MVFHPPAGAVNGGRECGVADVSGRACPAGTPDKADENFIKRVVGLPGDRVKVINDRIYVNDEVIPETEVGRYSDGCYDNLRLSEVRIGKHTHQAISCLSAGSLASLMPAPSCDRRIGRRVRRPRRRPSHANRRFTPIC